MTERADAHIHLFENGYQEAFAGRPGVQLDEALLYKSLAVEFGVRKALVIGYADRPWCAANNDHIADLADRNWIHPVAFHTPPAPGLADLAELQRQRFVGLSFYILDDERAAALQQVDAGVWRWLTERNWVVSVNSRGALWSAWRPILDRHSDLRLIVSHLGLPPRVATPPTLEAAGDALADVTALAGYPGTRVKLSGFYALSDPGHDYPHEAAWPYVQVLLDAFGAERLLWASDFSPSLDWLSFPQTFELFRHMPFLNDEQRALIEGANLLKLLGEIQ